MKVPDLTRKEAYTIVDSAYSRFADDLKSGDVDYLIADESYKLGVDAARDDILTAIELFQNYPGMEYVESWQEALNEVKSYIFTHLDLNEWYTSPL